MAAGAVGAVFSYIGLPNNSKELLINHHCLRSRITLKHPFCRASAHLACQKSLVSNWEKFWRI